MQNQIPNNWQKDILDNVAEEIFSGGTPDTRKPEYWNGDLKWLSSGETGNKFIYDTKQKITEKGVKNSSTSLGHIGDVVIASAGQGNTRGQTSFLKTDTYINQSIIDIRTNQSHLNNLFLYYNLSGRYPELRSISDSTSIRGSLTTKIFKELEILFPKEVKDQQKIASLLYSFDQKIELNNKIAKTLEEMAQAIFKEWFVNFHFPGYEKTEFVNSDIGKIPRDWKLKTLDELLILKHGLAFKSEEFTNKKTKYVVVRMGNFQENGGLQFLDNTVYLKEISKFEKYILKPGDMMMILSDITREGRLIGKVGLIPQDENTYVLNQRVARLETDEKYEWFLLMLFGSKKFHQHCLARADSATVLNLKNEHIYKYLTVEPPQPILEIFNELIEPVITKLELIRKANQNLSLIRDLLLPRLMRGELKI